MHESGLAHTVKVAGKTGAEARFQACMYFWDFPLNRLEVRMELLARLEMSIAVYQSCLCVRIVFSD